MGGSAGKSPKILFSVPNKGIRWFEPTNIMFGSEWGNSVVRAYEYCFQFQIRVSGG